LHWLVQLIAIQLFEIYKRHSISKKINADLCLQHHLFALLANPEAFYSFDDLPCFGVIHIENLNIYNNYANKIN